MTDLNSDELHERNPIRDHLKNVEAERDRLAAELAKAEAERKELAVLRAGFAPDSKQAKALLRLHEGDFTPEALNATAAEYGLIDPPPATTAPAEEQRQWTQMAQNSTAGGPVNSEPRDEAYWAKRLKEAKSQQEFDAVMAEARSSGLVG